MVEKKNSSIIARRQARERLAHERSRQAERNRANEQDLTEYLLLRQRIDAADAEYVSAVSLAQRRRDEAISALRHRQEECLRRMDGRGDAPDDIAARTGLAVKDVRRILGGRRRYADPASEGGPADEY
jgi:DNA-directed RNA polymerase specialized sigma24 family protein